MISIHGKPAEFVSVLQALQQAARERGDAHAIEVSGVKLSFKEWLAGAEAVAAQLAALGVEKGDRVATVMHNHAALLFVWFGAWRLGAIWSPLNVALKGEDLRYTLRDCDPRVLIVDAQTLDGVAALRDAKIESLPRFVVESDSREGFRPFAELLAAAPLAPEVPIGPDDPAVITYTGGTTGLPKGVVLPHFAYVAGGYRYREFWQPVAGDVHYTVLQLFHVGCQHGAVLAPLFAGITSVIDRWFSASNYWPRVRETRATLIDPLGTMLAILNKQPEGPLDRQHRVRCCWFATAHLPVSIRDQFEQRFGVSLRPGSYAQSETGGNYVVSQRLDDPEHPKGACGKPWGWAELRIVDEFDNPVPPGTVGEIVLRPVVPYTFMLGYHNKPEVTRKALRNQWFHSGDQGWLDENGYMFFRGRAAYWLRRRGENISAFEVESIIAEHPAVSEVAVVGVPSELGEEEVKAFIIVAPDTELEPAALVAWCDQRMTRFKVPRFVEFVADFPRSAAKREVLREVLRARGNAASWDRQASESA
jgi:crotonobetaine/carnitine-CoA ligase